MRRTLVPLLSTRSVVLFGAMLIALALIVLAIGTSAKQADAASRILTKTFSNSQQILIPGGQPTASDGAALPYPSLISAAFPTRSKVRDVNVTLRNFTHTFPGDVDVLLVHAGTNRTIMSDIGGSNDVNNITINLDDEASTPLPDDASQPVAGTFKPTNRGSVGDFDDFPTPAPPPDPRSALSGFDGSKADGGWKLFVVDEAPGDVGSFGGGWTVKIKAAVPQ